MFYFSNAIIKLGYLLFDCHYSDHLFSDQFYTDVTPAVQDILTNGSLMLSVIAYKNLTNFLPKMYFDRNR